MKFKKYFILVILSITGITIVSFVSFNNTKYTLNPNIWQTSHYKIKIEQTFNLPDLVRETSGLIYFDQQVWTFNDSGGEPEIYAYSLKDSCLKNTIPIWNAKNYDWEEISQDSNFVYIGDFGNNFGWRNNLCIYKIKKENLLHHKIKAVKAEKIHFTYPDYHPAGLTFKRSAFDCEAMVILNESIYLFTKNWLTFTTSIYKIPSDSGNYVAVKLGEFNSLGLISAATLFNGQLTLLGYMKGIPFLWKFHDLNILQNKHVNGERIDLEQLKGRQTEGITMIDSSTMLISAEKTSFPPQLFKINIAKK